MIQELRAVKIIFRLVDLHISCRSHTDHILMVTCPAVTASLTDFPRLPIGLYRTGVDIVLVILMATLLV